MCGIIGIVGKRPVAPLLLEGLKRLEYRGYDSAGIATVDKNIWQRLRAEGKLAKLESALARSPLEGATGIGHTRWATHGVPNEANAHPHATDKVAVVHNGIIENFRELRAEMEAGGIRFESQTDTEIVPQLITHYLAQGICPKDAVAATLARLEGAFALGIIFRDAADLLIAARKGSPLAIGYGEGEMYLGSDAIALEPLTSKLSYLQDGDWAVLTKEGAVIYDRDNRPVARDVRQSRVGTATAGKEGYAHFMLKEIHEQPGVVAETLSVFASAADGNIHLPPLPFALEDVRKVTLIACGTSYYAGLVARYWLEHYAKLSVETDIASEYRYRDAPVNEGDLAIFISQSGETADTLAALRRFKAQGGHTLAIVNVPESTMALQADAVLHTYAGPEIGVASTKAFTTQLATLACLTLKLAQARDAIDKEEQTRLLLALLDVPARLSEALHHKAAIAGLASHFTDARSALYIGRGTSYPIALEGALKLKEISYIHAEGYAAGELKHGPIALIDKEMPVVVIAPGGDELFAKTASNMQEAAARGGKIIVFTDVENTGAFEGLGAEIMALPKLDRFTAPIVYALPMQLLAYHVAAAKGADIDQPRNLAKSVTVE